jgi:hypothetical protein
VFPEVSKMGNVENSSRGSMRLEMRGREDEDSGRVNESQ